MSQNDRGMSERARFEAWARNNTAMPCIQCRITGEYYSTTTQLAWQAWQARCPEGYSVVPKEPAEQMLDSWFEANRDDLPCQFVTPYKAMLAAAPQPGEEG